MRVSDKKKSVIIYIDIDNQDKSIILGMLVPFCENLFVYASVHSDLICASSCERLGIRNPYLTAWNNNTHLCE